MQPACAFEEGSARRLPGGGLISPNQGGASFLHPLPQAGRREDPPSYTRGLLLSFLESQRVPPVTHLGGEGHPSDPGYSRGPLSREEHMDTSPWFCPPMLQGPLFLEVLLD